MILTWLKSAALLALIVFLSFGSYLLWQTARIEGRLANQASATLTASNAAIAHVNTATDQVGTAFTSAATSVTQTEADVRNLTTQFGGVATGLQKTVALVNAPCVPGPCGTVADIGKTLNTSRLAIGEVEIAADDFNKNEATFYSQEDQLYQDGDTAFKNLDSLLASPDLNTAIHNTGTITNNLGQTTTDFQNRFHAFLYPPPCQGFKCHIKGIYETVKVGSTFAEPAYWGWALFSGIKP
jgi:hypothetical protein